MYVAARVHVCSMYRIGRQFYECATYVLHVESRKARIWHFFESHFEMDEEGSWFWFAFNLELVG